MTKIKLLVVEDDPQDIGTCKRTVERYQHEWQREFELVECRNVDEAFDKLDSTFDGAIIDLRLGNAGDEGNQVIQRIKERQYRFPVAILTGTPNAADPEFQYIGVFKKGDPGAGYYDLLDRFWKIQETGLTRILGGRGIIESRLGEVFWNNILPQISEWEAYGEANSARTENALLRHTLNHLIQLIDEDIESYFPEEFYLNPPSSKRIRTGSILREKQGDKWFVVMSPDCDLAVRNHGSRNTDRILVVEVVPPSRVLDWYHGTATESLSNSQQQELKRAFNNNKANYFHCLPATDFFPMGFLNFRYLSTLVEEEIGRRFFMPPRIQIAPPFVKDMVARFSSYYARQGQPDVDLPKSLGSDTGH